MNYMIFIEEIIRAEAESIKRAIRLLNARERTENLISPSLAADRVQGGERTPQALRLLEIDDCLKGCSERLVKIARAFLGLDNLKAQAYIWGLLDGLPWESIRKRGRIKEEDRRKFQEWLIELFGVE